MATDDLLVSVGGGTARGESEACRRCFAAEVCRLLTHIRSGTRTEREPQQLLLLRLCSSDGICTGTYIENTFTRCAFLGFLLVLHHAYLAFDAIVNATSSPNVVHGSAAYTHRLQRALTRCALGSFLLVLHHAHLAFDAIVNTTSSPNVDRGRSCRQFVVHHC